MKPKQSLYIALITALLLLPLFIHRNKKDGFSGADGQAENAISELAPDYKPWMTALFEPPSGEVESLLFALQAALGAGFIGYFFGVQRERKRASLRPQPENPAPNDAAPGSDAGSDAGSDPGSTSC